MRPSALALPTALSLAIAACGSGYGSGGPSGFDLIDAQRLGYGNSSVAATEIYSGTTRQLSANETVRVDRTGPTTITETYTYGAMGAAPAQYASADPADPALANGRVPWFSTTSRRGPKAAPLAARNAWGYLSSRTGDGLRRADLGGGYDWTAAHCDR